MTEREERRCNKSGGGKSSLNAQANVCSYDGSIWDALRKVGWSGGVSPAEWILSQLPEPSPVVEERIRKGLEELQEGRISTRKWKTLLGVLLHGLKLDITKEELESLRSDLKCLAWRSRSLSPEFLNYVGASPSTFCIVPDPWWLAKLYEPWSSVSEKHRVNIEKGIRSSLKLAKKSGMWLNRWKNGVPIGLWHWSWRSSSGVGYLNGGRFFMQNIWAVFTEEGAVPVVRASIQGQCPTPPGAVMSSGRSSFKYEPAPWNPDIEENVYFVDGINMMNPEYPSLSQRKIEVKAA